MSDVFENAKVGDKFKAGRLLPNLPESEGVVSVRRTGPLDGELTCDLEVFGVWVGEIHSVVKKGERKWEQV